MKDYQSAAHLLVEVIPFFLRKVGSEFRCIYDGIMPSHFRLMAMLQHHPGNLSMLAEQQEVSMATISNTISTLVEKGWVQRTPSDKDRRTVQVELTPEGKKTVMDIHDQLEGRVSVLFSSLTPGEICQLEDGLRILKKMLEGGRIMNTVTDRSVSIPGDPIDLKSGRSNG